MLFLINWQCRDQSEDAVKRRLKLIGHWDPVDRGVALQRPAT